MQRTRSAWCGPLRSVKGIEVKRLNFSSCRWQEKQKVLLRSLAIRAVNVTPVMTASPARATAHNPRVRWRTGGAWTDLSDRDGDGLREEDVARRGARAASREVGARASCNGVD